MNESKLVACPLFKGMSKEEHDAFLERNINEMVKFAKGETVVRQGDTIRAMYLLIDGVVRTQMITREGNILEIDLLEAVIPLASAFMYASNNKFPVDVICMEPCTFLKISKSAWLEEMVHNEKLLMNFLTLNSNMTVFLSKKIQMISLKSLRHKLCVFLLEKTTPEKNYFILKRSRTQLAEYFGVQRPSLARTFKELEDEKVITTSGRVVTILERNKLFRM